MSGEKRKSGEDEIKDGPGPIPRREFATGSVAILGTVWERISPAPDRCIGSC